MSLELDLAPEHRAEYERLRANRPPPSDSCKPGSRPYDRFVEPAVSSAAVARLRANPLADADPEHRVGPAPKRDKAGEFLAAVASKYAPGEVVTRAAAAAAAGEPTSNAGYFIGRLKARGEWPYAAGAPGRAAGEKVRPPREPSPAPVIAKPAPVIEKPAPVIAPSPSVVAPPPSGPMGHDLAGMPARLREAADLIERAMGLIGLATGEGGGGA